MALKTGANACSACPRTLKNYVGVTVIVTIMLCQFTAFRHLKTLRVYRWGELMDNAQGR